MSKETALLLLDTGNIYKDVAKKFSGKRVCYEKFLTALGADWDIYKKVAFGAYREANKRALAFTHALSKLDFVTHFTVLEDNTYYNPLADVMIEVFKNVEKIDWLILGSSSLKYTPLIKFLQENAIRVCMVGCNMSILTTCKPDRIIEINESYLISGEI